MALKDLRKTSAALKQRLLDETIKNKTSGGNNQRQSDDRFWQPTIDKAGNGSAIIRFLPPPDGEDLPWAKVFRHSFKNPKTNQWYIENCLTTLGQPDPVADYNTQLWNTGEDELKNQARDQKRQLRYVVNILVISDPKNPQNEGKVFLYGLGKKLWDKIEEVMHPEDGSDEDGFNPFDFWEGADFRLKIKNVAGYRNYDSSKFMEPSPLFDGDDDELEKVYKQLNSLQAFLDPSQFKAYDVLKAKLDRVLGLGGNGKPAAKAVNGSARKPTPLAEAETLSGASDDDDDEDETTFDDDDEDLLSELESMAEDD